MCVYTYFYLFTIVYYTLLPVLFLIVFSARYSPVVVSFLPVFIYLLVVIYLPVLLTVYLLSVASLGVWYNPLLVPVYYFPIRLWSFADIALALSFVLNHLSHDVKLVEWLLVARVA